MKTVLQLALISGSVVSANAAIFEYSVSLTPPASVTSSGSGTGMVSYDDAAHTLQVQVAFANLTGNVTASHIHGPTASPFSGAAGVITATPTFPGFPSGVTSGSYSQTFDLTLSSSWNASFISANGGTTASAESVLANAMAEGRTYWNIHSSFAPGGEINGFLTRVPEPSSLALAGLGGLVLAATRRAKKQRS